MEENQLILQCYPLFMSGENHHYHLIGMIIDPRKNTTQYLKLHPGNETAFVMPAWAGFLIYNNFNRLHDYLRVTVGEKKNRMA